jgi:hypothetical protein cdifA_19763
LINCPACGRLVSNQAVSCPNCGQPIKPTNSKESISRELVTSPTASYNIPVQKKRGKGCIISCLFIIALVLIGFTVAITQGGKSQSAKYMNITQEEGEKIDIILSKCGLTNIESINHDELLDNAHFEGEKGYRIKANRINNIILYLYADNVVYSVRYAGNDLYLKGQLLSTLNDYSIY